MVKRACALLKMWRADAANAMAFQGVSARKRVRKFSPTGRAPKSAGRRARRCRGRKDLRFPDIGFDPPRIECALYPSAPAPPRLPHEIRLFFFESAPTLGGAGERARL